MGYWSSTHKNTLNIPKKFTPPLPILDFFNRLPLPSVLYLFDDHSTGIKNHENVNLVNNIIINLSLNLSMHIRPM